MPFSWIVETLEHRLPYAHQGSNAQEPILDMYAIARVDSRGILRQSFVKISTSVIQCNVMHARIVSMNQDRLNVSVSKDIQATGHIVKIMVIVKLAHAM
jgi:hypothetical protein